jgi:hypothetical protein
MHSDFQREKERETEKKPFSASIIVAFGFWTTTKQRQRSSMTLSIYFHSIQPCFPLLLPSLSFSLSLSLSLALSLVLSLSTTPTSATGVYSELLAANYNYVIVDVTLQGEKTFVNKREERRVKGNLHWIMSMSFSCKCVSSNSHNCSKTPTCYSQLSLPLSFLFLV